MNAGVIVLWHWHFAFEYPARRCRLAIDGGNV